MAAPVPGGAEGLSGQGQNDLKKIIRFLKKLVAFEHKILYRQGYFKA
ncbi:hypothetical protein [Desulfonatronospira thiodismutans]|nr:hypothetical protein [Desulfonatronospira thiodismutans]